jgi:tetratricopeptide (TPR) repeat protein
MAAFYLLGSIALAGGPIGFAQGGPNPDDLYRQRENMEVARQAADIWAARAAAGQDFEAAWKLARACYWIGTHDTESLRRPALERGVAAGEQAAKLKPDAPEGHFWMAANMGALAESFGLGQGIKYRGRIRDGLQRVLAIDQGWQQGSADRALGWWYHMVPGLFGGSEKKAEEHLRRALTYNPQSTATLYFLAEVLLEDGRKPEARTMFQQVLDVTVHPDWEPEDRDFKKKAAERLKTIK